MAVNYRAGEAQGYPVFLPVPGLPVNPGGPVQHGGSGTPLNQVRHVRPLRSVHTVTPGQNLADVAAMYGLTYQEIFKMNNHAIGNGVVHPGMRLQV
jgi:LysM domain-containing protein